MLFPYNAIASFFKKWFGGNGSMGCNISFNCQFQLVANRCSNSFSLIVCMNKQAVKITGFIYIAKAYNNSIVNGNQTVVLLK